jgi:hypothetical protein
MQIFSSDERQRFFSSTLPKIIELALSVDKLVTAPIPILKKRMTRAITLSQEQVSCPAFALEFAD